MFYWIFDLDETLYQMDFNKLKIKVHNGLYVDYSFLKQDKLLNLLLRYLKGNKIIMTNSISDHCQMVLKKINIRDCFDVIFDRNYMKHLKPHPQTYISLIKTLNINKKDTCIFFDDSPINLLMAKKFGWTTVLITPQPWKYKQSHNSIDFIFPNVHSAISFFIKKIYNV
jgi:pyrimidine 5'-nucleotidase